MPHYIISLGSNIPQGKEEIESAIRWFAGFSTVISRTKVYTTPDAHDSSRPQYTNAIAAIDCNETAEKLNKMLKSYEVLRGRIAGSASIPVDLDLVCRDNEVLRPRDYAAPYFVEGLYLLSSSANTAGGMSNR